MFSSEVVGWKVLFVCFLLCNVIILCCNTTDKRRQVSKNRSEEQGGQSDVCESCVLQWLSSSHAVRIQTWAVVPLACDDKMNRLLPSPAGRVLASGPGSPLLMGV